MSERAAASTGFLPGTGPHQVEPAVGMPDEVSPAEWGSDRMLDVLRDLGCRYLPINPGSSFRGLHDSIVNYGRNRDPQMLLCHHEGIAVAMAHGYAKATGRPGFAIIHDLVGLMQGTMGVYNALIDEVPLILVGGGGPADTRERRPIDWIHAASTQADLVRDFVKWDAEPIDLPGTERALAQGARVATTPPYGPVYVTVDAAVQEERLEAPLPPTVEATTPAQGFQLAAGVAEEVVDALLRAERPAIVVGTMSYDAAATAAVVALAEAVGAACFESEHASVIPSRFTQNLTGEFEVLQEADLILALGVRDLRSLIGPVLGRRLGTTQRAALDAPRIIDIGLRDLVLRSWSDVGATTQECERRLLAEPVGAARALSTAAAAADTSDFADRRQARRDELARRHDAAYKRTLEGIRDRWDESPIAPGRVVSELWDAVQDTPWQLILRNTRSWPLGVWDLRDANDYLGHSGGAGVGYGPGAAVGAALGANENGRFPVGIIGDGDLLSAPGAIWTAAHYRIPMLLVVNDNSSFYNDEGHQQSVALDRDRPVENAYIGMRMEDPQVDFASIARGYGAWARGPIEDPKELADAFREGVAAARDGATALVHVRTAPK